MEPIQGHKRAAEEPIEAEKAKRARTEASNWSYEKINSLMQATNQEMQELFSIMASPIRFKAIFPQSFSREQIRKICATARRLFSPTNLCQGGVGFFNNLIEACEARNSKFSAFLIQLGIPVSQKVLRLILQFDLQNVLLALLTRPAPLPPNRIVEILSFVCHKQNVHAMQALLKREDVRPEHWQLALQSLCLEGQSQAAHFLLSQEVPLDSFHPSPLHRAIIAGDLPRELVTPENLQQIWPLTGQTPTQLAATFHNRQMVDLLIEAQTTEGHNRAFLASRSRFFERQFHWVENVQEKKEIEVKDDPEIFNQILEFLYTDQLAITDDNFAQIARVANQYEFRGVKELLERWLTVRHAAIEEELNAGSSLVSLLGRIPSAIFTIQAFLEKLPQASFEASALRHYLESADAKEVKALLEGWVASHPHHADFCHHMTHLIPYARPIPERILPPQQRVPELQMIPFSEEKFLQFLVAHHPVSDQSFRSACSLSKGGGAVRFALENQFLDSSPSQLNSFLSTAVKANNYVTAKLLIEAGANREAIDAESGMTMLQLGATARYPEKSDVRFVKLLKTTPEFMNRVTNGRTALGIALNRYETDFAKELIREGADVTIRQNLYNYNAEDKTILEYLALEGDDAEMASLIVDHLPEDKKREFINSGKPIDSACNRGGEKMVRLLISHGADLSTALHHTRKAEIARILLEAIPQDRQGEFVNAPNQEGNTPLHCILEDNPDAEDLINLLIDSGANPWLTNHKTKQTFFHSIAIWQYAYKYFDRIWIIPEEQRANFVNQQDCDGDTVLHCLYDTITEEERDGVEIILRAGADLSIRNIKGETALDVALKNGDYQNLGLLIQYLPPLQKQQFQSFIEQLFPTRS